MTLEFNKIIDKLPQFTILGKKVEFKILLTIIFVISLLGVIVYAATDKSPVRENSEAAPTIVLRMFATSQLYDGNLGGLSGADAKCQSLATTAGWGTSTWVAWVSDSSTDAKDRYWDTIYPFTDMTGVTIAADLNDLVTCSPDCLITPVNYDENTTLISSAFEAYTGTFSDGTKYSTEFCSDWTSNSSSLLGAGGLTNTVSQAWTWAGNNSCDVPARIYCLEQASSPPAPSATPTPTVIPTTTASPTPTLIPSPTPTITPSPLPTNTPTPTVTPTPVPVCGNSTIEPPEICDSNSQACSVNGYLGSEDCSASCNSWDACVATETMGDGVINGPETCDDGNTISGDGCSNIGDIELGWQCTGEPSACTEIIGDGIMVGNEQCDDMNTADGDGCSSTGQIEPGWQCAGAPSICTEIIGDGVIVGGEQCDDRNSSSGDGCSSTGQIEPGWQCTGEPSVCTEIIGDGVIVGGEECDDGNTISGDGCSSIGQIEPGWQCTGEPSVCTEIIGDGIIVGGEECDDGNTASGDGCSSSGQIEPGWQCIGEPSVCTGIIGDGIIIGGEECDDGNSVSGDGCSNTGQIELGWQCTGEPSSCTEIIGDGIIVGGEECDDGSTISGDGCSSTGYIEPGWQCAGEPSVCTEIIGDGIIIGDEECDDGNTANGDGCSSTSEVEPGWQCTGTPSTCVEIIGDGIIVGDEECDDGNTTNGDGCSSSGQIEDGWHCSGLPSVCIIDESPSSNPIITPTVIPVPSSIRYTIKDLDSSLDAEDVTFKNIEYGSTSGLLGINNVNILDSDSSTLIATLSNVNFYKDLSWDNLSAGIDTSTSKSYLHIDGDLEGFDRDEGFRLFVPKDMADNALLYCPAALSLDDINYECEEGVLMLSGDEYNDIILTTISIDGQIFWLLDGLSGSGAQSLDADQVDEYEKSTAISPTINAPLLQADLPETGAGNTGSTGGIFLAIYDSLELLSPLVITGICMLSASILLLIIILIYKRKRKDNQ